MDEVFDKYIIEKLGEPDIPNKSLEDMHILFDKDNYNYDVEVLEETVELYEPEAQIPKSDNFTVYAMDKFLNYQV